MEVMLKHKLWKDIRGFDKPSWEFEIREMQKKDIIADYCLDWKDRQTSRKFDWWQISVTSGGGGKDYVRRFDEWD